MRVDVDAFAVGCLQKILEVQQVVPAHQDALALGTVLGDGDRCGNAEPIGVCFAEQPHRLDPRRSQFHQLGDVLVEIEVHVRQREVHRLGEHVVDFLRIGPKVRCVCPIGREALNAEDHQVLQARQVLVLAARSRGLPI